MPTTNPRQARELNESIRPKFGSLIRLRERMERAAMTGDTLFPVVSAAGRGTNREMIGRRRASWYAHGASTDRDDRIGSWESHRRQAC